MIVNYRAAARSSTLLTGWIGTKRKGCFGLTLSSAIKIFLLVAGKRLSGGDSTLLLCARLCMRAKLKTSSNRSDLPGSTNLIDFKYWFFCSEDSVAKARSSNSPCIASVFLAWISNAHSRDRSLIHRPSTICFRCFLEG